SQGAFLLGKPLGNGLDASRKIPRFAQPEHEAREPKSKNATCEGVAHRRQTPHADGKCISNPGAYPVHQSADYQKPQCVGSLKCCNDVAVLDLIPSDDVLELWSQQSEDLAIHVIDSGSKKQKRTRTPAV